MAKDIVNISEHLYLFNILFLIKLIVYIHYLINLFIFLLESHSKNVNILQNLIE